jgi:hypothetical protein
LANIGKKKELEFLVGLWHTLRIGNHPNTYL